MSLGTVQPGFEIATGARATQDWFNFAVSVSRFVNSFGSGVTASRPTKLLFVGRRYFDTTLGKPVWYDGTNWVDATGASV